MKEALNENVLDFHFFYAIVMKALPNITLSILFKINDLIFILLVALIHASFTFELQ